MNISFYVLVFLSCFIYNCSSISASWTLILARWFSDDVLFWWFFFPDTFYKTWFGIHIMVLFYVPFFFLDLFVSALFHAYKY